MEYLIKDYYNNDLLIRPRLELYYQRDLLDRKMPGLAIVLDDITDIETPTEYCVLTVSFGEYIPVKNCAYIDSNLKYISDQLKSLGMGEDTGLSKRCSYHKHPLWIFDEKLLNDMGAENYQKYSKEYDEYMSEFGPINESVNYLGDFIDLAF